MWVARRSAVLARLLGLRFAAAGAAGVAEEALGVVEPVEADAASTGGGRASVWTGAVGETGVAGPLEPSAEDGGDWGAGEAETGEEAEMVMAIQVR